MNIVRFIFWGVLGLILTGCAAVPKVRISNVEREKIAKALWEEGGTRSEHLLGYKRSKTIWPSYEVIDKLKTVIKYNLVHHINLTTSGRDTITIVTESTKDVTVSLKCEEKNVLMSNWAEQLMFPKRNLYRERTVLLNAVRKLEKEYNASAEWLGKWRPANQPVIVSAGNSRWIAYTGGSPSLVVNYFTQKGYRRSNNIGTEPICFTRELHNDPFNDGSGRITRLWESREKALLKTVKQQGNPASDTEVVVVGIGCTGFGYIKNIYFSFLFGKSTIKEEWIDGGKKLCETVIGHIVNYASVQTCGITFIDPTPWIEEIEIEPIYSDFANEARLMIGRQEE